MSGQTHTITLDQGDRVPLNGTHVTGALHRQALAALEDVIAGSDGWGCELQVYAIDGLRYYLRLPPWCARCCKEGHKTYDHWVTVCVKCGASGGHKPVGSGPFTHYVPPGPTEKCPQHDMRLKDITRACTWAMFSDTGNAMAWTEDEAEAQRWAEELRVENDATTGVLKFDKEGRCVGRLWPDPEPEETTR